MSEATPGGEPESASEEPKVIVDEDWKSRVQAEREAARAARAAGTASASQGSSADQAAGESPAGAPAGSSSAANVPEASFAVLVNSLAVQTMASLGALPDPVEGHAVVRPDLAKHYIDTLSMLEAKTQGNLTAEESQLLTTALHQLRMLFISVRAPEGKSVWDVYRANVGDSKATVGRSSWPALDAQRQSRPASRLEQA